MIVTVTRPEVGHSGGGKETGAAVRNTLYRSLILGLPCTLTAFLSVVFPVEAGARW